jgi:hypothetical protein
MGIELRVLVLVPMRMDPLSEGVLEGKLILSV